MDRIHVERLWWLGLLAGMVAGCSHSERQSGAAQQTIAADVNRDTERAKAENTRAVALIRQGKYEEGETALKSALAADGLFGPAHNNLGRVYYHQRRLYQAAWEFEYASKLMPSQPEPRNNLGLVFEASGKLDDAIKQYDEAMKLDPENPEFIGNAARVRIRRGDRDDAVRQLLSRLVVRDTRPEWVQWAKDKLGTLPRAKAE